LGPLFERRIVPADVFAAIIRHVKTPNMAISHVGAGEEERAVRAFERLLPGVYAMREIESQRVGIHRPSLRE